MLALTRTASVLNDVINKKANLTAVLNSALPGIKNKNIRSRIYLYSFGVLRNLFAIDSIIADYASKRLSKKHRMLLRVAVYALFYLSPGSPGYIVNSAVESFKKTGARGLAPFINAVLRRISKERIAIKRKLETLEPHLKISFSKEWFDYFIERYGAEQGENILRQMNKPPVTEYFVLNREAHNSEDIIKKLKKHTGNVHLHPRFDDVIEVSGLKNITDFSEAFSPPLLHIDYPFILASKIAEKYARGTMLDAFAGIGSKFLLAAAGANYAVACDIDRNKIRYAKQAYINWRGTSDNVSFICGNSFDMNGLYSEKFDFIMLDVPCTGLGSIARKPDIRYHCSPADIASFAERDKHFVEEAAALLKEGGKLLYSTCTLTFEENEGIIEYARKELGLKYAANEFGSGNIKFLPDAKRNSGAFMALLEK